MTYAEWEFPVTYGAKTYQIRASLEYVSVQIMRIHVHGVRSAITLDTNYPVTRQSGARNAITWKLTGGKFDVANLKSARLLKDIFLSLEEILKEEYPKFL